MANPKDPKEKRALREEEFVARSKAGTGGETPVGLTSFVGLLGRSAREGCWLLYPTLDMATSLEIEEADVVYSEALPPEQSPFGGLGGTRVFVRRGARVTTARTVATTRRAGIDDDFDLDVRVGKGAARGATAGWKVTLIASCDNTNCPTCRNTCAPCPTDHTCGTCADTCTCDTRCGTCRTECGTCQTQCGTCATPCGTCQTCGQATCLPTCQDTCRTCDTQCFQETCRTVCFGTCNDTCDGCTRPPRCIPQITDVC
jgi:hypothetical protein